MRPLAPRVRPLATRLAHATHSVVACATLCVNKLRGNELRRSVKLIFAGKVRAFVSQSDVRTYKECVLRTGL